MLQSVELKNFQSHRNTKLNFDKGVNVIIGTSDSGKSAILRALNSCIYGELPVSYRTYDTEETEVTIKVDDKEVTRRRGEKTNEYQVNNSYYRALNRTVPEDVTTLFNMNDINIQYQLDGPFLLSETPGEIAKRLNKTVNLDIIDASIKQSNSMRNEVLSSVKHYKEELSRYESELEKFKNFSAFEQKVNDLIENDKEITKLSSDVSFSKSCIDSYHTYNLNIKNSKEKLTSLEKTEKVLSSVISYEEEINKVTSTITKIKDIITSYNTYSEKLKQDNKKRVRCSAVLDSLNILNTITEKGKQIRDTYTALTNTINKYKIIQKDILKNKENLIDSNKELSSIMPAVCPLCGSSISKEE